MKDVRIRIGGYFSVFRPRWLHENYPNYFLSYFVLLWSFLVLWPMMAKIWNEGWEACVGYYLTAVPILLAIYVTPLHPIALPKLLYLCPMSREERKRELWKAYLFKIAVPAVLSICMMTVLVVLDITSPLFALLTVLATLLQAVCFGSMTTQKLREWTKKNGIIMNSMSGWELVGRIVASLCSYVYMLLCIAEAREEVWAGIIAALVLLPEIPVAVGAVKRAVRVVEQAMQYEDACIR